MVKFIKAYNEGRLTVFELSTKAVRKDMAEGKAVASLLGRRPSQATSVHSVDSVDIGSGIRKEYRVVVKIDPSESVIDRIRISEAADRLRDLL